MSERRGPEQKTLRLVERSVTEAKTLQDSAPTIRREPPADADPFLGRQIHNWVITSKLGAGGMGTIYLATDPRMPKARKVVKVLPGDATVDERARFVREALTAAEVGGDERVVKIESYGEFDDGRSWILMEHIEGSTLKEELAREGIFSEEKALKQIAHRLADTFAVLHAADIVHRDLKPANIILQARRGGGLRVKVIDFGLARAPTAVGGYKTDARLISGTPGYWSPEQVQALAVDHRTDVFALGVIMFEMLSGERPFPADGDAIASIGLLLSSPTPSLNAVRAKKGTRPVAASVESLITDCLKKDPETRPAMVAVHRRLTEILDELGSGGIVMNPHATMRSVAPPELLESLARPSSASAHELAQLKERLDSLQDEPSPKASAGAPFSAKKTNPGKRLRTTGPSRRRVLTITAAGLVTMALIGIAVLLEMHRTVESNPPPTAENTSIQKEPVASPMKPPTVAVERPQAPPPSAPAAIVASPHEPMRTTEAKRRRAKKRDARPADQPAEDKPVDPFGGP